MAQSQHFSPADFTPSKFSTAEQKAIFGNQLLAFVAAGFPEKKFTNALYERLSNCFGFIAHMNRNGFFETFFTCIADKLRFIQALANAPRYGDPAYTFSDVERAIGEVVRSMGWEVRNKIGAGKRDHRTESAYFPGLRVTDHSAICAESAVIRTNAKTFEML